MKDIPSSLKSLEVAKRVVPPTDFVHQQTMTPTSALLFRFSALTCNTHAVHLDPDYSRRAYGIPRLLVHGPLTSVLMLDTLRQAIKETHPKLNPNDAVQTFEYKNLSPLWVDEPITVACRILRDVPSTPSQAELPDAQIWETMIIRGQGESTTVAVRGRARISLGLDR
jgi:hydroxyacyl-ACP dehydratase HTD2-like protein with hotdog domain